MVSCATAPKERCSEPVVPRVAAERCQQMLPPIAAVICALLAAASPQAAGARRVAEGVPRGWLLPALEVFSADTVARWHGAVAGSGAIRGGHAALVDRGPPPRVATGAGPRRAIRRPSRPAPVRTASVRLAAEEAASLATKGLEIEVVEALLEHLQSEVSAQPGEAQAAEHESLLRRLADKALRGILGLIRGPRSGLRDLAGVMGSTRLPLNRTRGHVPSAGA